MTLQCSKNGKNSEAKIIHKVKLYFTSFFLSPVEKILQLQMVLDYGTNHSLTRPVHFTFFSDF